MFAAMYGPSDLPTWAQVIIGLGILGVLSHLAVDLWRHRK